MARVHIDQAGAFCPHCGSRQFRKRMGGMTKCLGCSRPLRRAGMIGKARGRRARKASQRPIPPVVIVAPPGAPVPRQVSVPSSLPLPGPVHHSDSAATLFLGPFAEGARRLWARLNPPFPPSITAVRACRECGCTDDAACEGGCWWVEADLCSACQPVDREPLDVRDPYTGTIEYF